MTSRIVVIPTRRAHSNHAEVARSIGVDIIASRYAEGARLPGDAELIAMFGVSRPVLRESVKTLVAKGLFTTKARVGTVVRERQPGTCSTPMCWPGISMPASTSVFSATSPRSASRSSRAAAALAAAQRSEQDIADFAAAWNGCGSRLPNSVSFADADLALHVAVAQASGNLFMRSIGHVIEAALRASFLLSAPVEPEDRDTVLLWHQKSSTRSRPAMPGRRRRRWSMSFTTVCAAMRDRDRTAPAEPLPSAESGK